MDILETAVWDQGAMYIPLRSYTVYPSHRLSVCKDKRKELQRSLEFA